MTLIERYIGKNVLVLLATILAVITALGWAIEALGKINFVTTSGQGVVSFINLSILLIPAIMVTIIPFAITIAIAQTLYTLNQNSETVIIANAGGSRLYIWRPIIAIGLIFSLSLFLIANFVVPLARTNIRNIIAEANANFLNSFIHENKFIELQKNLFIKIGSRTESSSINNLLIADERDKLTDRYYYADSGHIVQQEASTILMMTNGQMTKRNKINGETSLVNFSEYNFDLSTFLPVGSHAYFYPKDLTLSALLSYPHSGDEYKKYAVEIHSRLTSWLYPLLFTIIALLFNADPATYRGTKSNTPLFFTAGLTLVIYISSYFFKAKAQANTNYIAALYLAPIIILFIGHYLSKHSKNLLPTPTPNKVKDIT